jgi:hydroxyethylthiazole kinase
MGLAGEIAFENLLPGEGNSTYRNKIIDAIYNMSAEDLEKGAKYEIK